MAHKQIWATFGHSLQHNDPANMERVWVAKKERKQKTELNHLNMCCKIFKLKNVCSNKCIQNSNTMVKAQQQQMAICFGNCLREKKKLHFGNLNVCGSWHMPNWHYKWKLSSFLLTLTIVRLPLSFFHPPQIRCHTENLKNDYGSTNTPYVTA